MLHMIGARCVARDLHMTAPRPVERTCWRQFAGQWGDCQKSGTGPLNAIIIVILIDVADQTFYPPSHSRLTPSQPVPALTLQDQVPGRVATSVPIFKPLVSHDPEKSQCKWESNPRSAVVEAVKQLRTWFIQALILKIPWQFHQFSIIKLGYSRTEVSFSVEQNCSMQIIYNFFYIYIYTKYFVKWM